MIFPLSSGDKLQCPDDGPENLSVLLTTKAPHSIPTCFSGDPGTQMTIKYYIFDLNEEGENK